MSSVISLFSYKQGRLGKIGARDMRYSHNSYWGLTFTAEEANSTISMAKTGTPPAVSLETSINNSKVWTPFIVGTTTITLANIGDKVRFRARYDGTGGGGINNALASSISEYNYFSMTGKIAASGDISSILNRNQSVSTLNSYAFTYLFKDCTSLTTAPVLTVTTLAEGCYFGMFYGCTSLTTAPTLPATTLANHCYSGMFYGCTSLTTAPSTLSATTLANSCYAYMFKDCVRLRAAPYLPATTLVTSCYVEMFKGCTSLASLLVGFTAWDDSATNQWVDGVPQSGSFAGPLELSHTSSDFGISKIPTGWAVYDGTVPFITSFRQGNLEEGTFHCSSSEWVILKGAGFRVLNILTVKVGHRSGNTYDKQINVTEAYIVDDNTIRFKLPTNTSTMTDEELREADLSVTLYTQYAISAAYSLTYVG